MWSHLQYVEILLLETAKFRGRVAKIAECSEEMWNMSTVIGSIMENRIQCPKLTGIQFYNFKGFFSIVLLSFYHVWSWSVWKLQRHRYIGNVGDLFENEHLNIPNCRVISEEFGALPYYLLGNEIFPLTTWLRRKKYTLKKYTLIGTLGQDVETLLEYLLLDG